MLMLIGGLVIFFAIHLIPTKPILRTRLINAVGELGYKALFAIVAIVGFYFIVMGKADAPFTHVWTPPEFLRHVTMLFVLIAFVLLPAAYIPSNIRTKLKHPMLIAVKSWALGHLLINGDLASMILFGSFLAYAVIAMVSLKKRGVLPTTGKQPIWKDATVVVVGLAAYAFVAAKHGYLFGVPVIAAM